MVEFSIVPIGKGESLSQFVARCTKIVQESGLPNQLNPMGTVIEGEWDEVFGVIKECFEELRKDCSRISLYIKVDYREGKDSRMEQKVRSVMDKLSP